MQNKAGLIRLGVVLTLLWAAVVVAYARQVKQDAGDLSHLMEINASCSSSSSNNSSGSREK